MAYWSKNNLSEIHISQGPDWSFPSLSHYGSCWKSIQRIKILTLLPPTTSPQYRNSEGFLDGSVATGERKIQSLEVFNSFFYGTTWTILVEGEVFWRVKVGESAYRSLVVQISRGTRRMHIVDESFQRPA